MWYKQIENGYIVAIGIGGGGVSITEEEYNEIMTIIQSKPPRANATDYHLREDLTWEAFEIEYIEVEEPPEAEELLDILLGGDGE